MAGPDFIGIGAQKAGTSWIYTCLQAHPGLCMPIKEVHFFSRERNWSKGRQWYESLFTNCVDGQLCGEFSTSYLQDVHTPERIKKLYPNVKIIISLRNPIDRTFSHYCNALKGGQVPVSTSLQEAVELEPSLISNSCYSKQLPAWLELFDENQILILEYEDSKKDPVAFIQSIYKFLDVDCTFSSNDMHQVINIARMPRSPFVELLFKKLSHIADTKMMRPIWHLSRKMGINNALLRLNAIESKLIVMQDDDRLYLSNILHLEAEAVRTLLHRPSLWQK